jgi:hypothetical protein
VLKIAGLMIAAELSQRRLVQLKQNLAQLLGFRIAGCEISKNAVAAAAVVAVYRIHNAISAPPTMQTIISPLIFEAVEWALRVIG